MCGIVGILGESTRQNIETMVSAMHHRGPDDSGIFYEQGIALAMARLAIIDTTPSGHQPMANTDKTVWIVYNGETFNFREEREVLKEKGHSFVSSSDTEVVLRMYEAYGDDFLLRMRGMFALAVYDMRGRRGKERLLLARDHIGIKPLLYAHAGARFIFASEMKAMLASGLVSREVDPEGLRLLLTFGSVTQPHTIVKGVRMLLPGHRLIVEAGNERVEQYWRLGTDRVPGLRNLPYQELVPIVRTALEESVRLQMVSDVPVGAFLSGGVDSSLLVALMARNTSHRIKTYSVGYGAEGADIDETNDADRVARFIGTDHSRVVVTGQDVADRILHIAGALDQPTVDGVNSYFVSQAARTGVTVALSGTGGDESFAGYPWFIQMVVACAKDKRHPGRAAIRRLVAEIAQSPFFDRLPIRSLDYPLERLRSSYGFLAKYARIYQIFGSIGAGHALSDEFRAACSVGREPARDIAGADELSAALPLERVSGLCMRGYLQNQLLRDIDAVSMAHSLEVRVPFLDPAIVDLALSLPIDVKLGDVTRLPDPTAATYRDTGTKRILVDIGRELLPEGMDQQMKRGFAMPFDVWLKGPLREVLEDTLSESSVKRRGLFNYNHTAALRKGVLEGRTGWPQPWLLMMTELWCREVLDHRNEMKR